SPNLTALPDERLSALVSITESSIQPGLLWAGSNDGNVYVKRDDTTEWTPVHDNIPGVPRHHWVKRIEASHHEPGRAYLVFDGHRYQDLDPYVYVTEDYGESWRNITSDLPEGSVYAIREDYKNPDLLFVGTEFAVHVSIDRGERWSRFMNDMPTVPVHDLVIHPRDADLIAGTHGRGAWIADNITSLQQLTPEVMEKEVHLFGVRPEVQWLSTYEFSWTTDKRFYKDNPPTGSTISYYVRSESDDSARVEILDVSGEVLRALAGGVKAGINAIIWDHREPPPPETDEDSGRRRRRRLGALIPPGEYLVRLTIGDDVQTTRLVIEKDNPGYMGR
ncbi:MAG: hypothetical protein KAJ42_05580, partial [Gemmatimonadetes bacterium]|nr:hypothetical protein [Gemmatimonadota bacterium]